MKKLILIILLLFSLNNLHAKDNLKFYIKKALENNLQLNAERKSFESAKQSKNISRSEFLPSITLWETKQALLLQIKQIRVELVYLTLI